MTLGELDSDRLACARGEQPADPVHAVAPLLDRRSVKTFGADGPTAEQLDAILAAAVTVPDHGGLRPWRLVVVEGDARAHFGDALADAGRAARPDLPDPVADRLRSKAFVAPALIAVAARVDPEAKIDVWEQVASASCAGYAIALAADRIGLGAIWKSAPFRDGPLLRTLLDLGPHDEFLGWVNVGSLPEGFERASRPAVDLAPIVRTVTPDGATVAY